MAILEILGGGLLGGFLGRSRAPDYGPVRDAIKYSADRQFEASEANRKAWEAENARQRADYAPYREYGLRLLQELEGTEWTSPEWNPGDKYALPPLWDGYETKIPEFDSSSVDPTSLPGYEFRRRQGEKAIMRRAAAGSGVRSGATMKALTRFNSEFAGAEYAAAHGRALQEYQIDAQRALALRAAEREQYDLEVQRTLRERELARNDVLTQQDLLNAQHDRVLSRAATLGLGAINRSNELSYGIIGQQAQQRSVGASALGAGAIGGATAGVQGQIEANRVRQQNLQNIFRGMTFGTNLAGGLAA